MTSPASVSENNIGPALSFAVVVVLAVLALAAAHAGDQMRMHLDAGLLTLEADQVPLAEVVAAIGQRAGFELIIVGDLDDPVSVSFTALPVRKVLEDLLRDTDRILVYAPNNEGSKDRAIVKLWIFESSDAPPNPNGVKARQAMLDEGLKEGLRHPDAKTRSVVVLRLANIGATEEVLEALTEALQGDEDALVRSRAAIALGKLGDERTVSALESALSDENGTVRAQAIHALGQIDSVYATTILGDVLVHGTDNRQRVIAAWGLSRRDTPLAHQYLDAVVNDPDKQVRAASKIKPGEADARAIEIPANQHRLGTESIR